MATRFDRVTAPPRTRPRTIERPDERARVRQSPVEFAHSEAYSASSSAEGRGGRVLPVRPLAAAMATWLAAVWISCYVGGPALLTSLGMPGGASAYTVAAVPAFVLASFAVAIGVLAARPAIHLTGRPSLRDPILAAVSGSLAVWVVTQNGVPELLRPFAAMSAGEIGAHLALNGLEASLLGVMFASFTRHTAAAFALGASFKLALMGLALALLALL